MYVLFFVSDREEVILSKVLLLLLNKRSNYKYIISQKYNVEEHQEY